VILGDDIIIGFKTTGVTAKANLMVEWPDDFIIDFQVGCENFAFLVFGLGVECEADLIGLKLSKRNVELAMKTLDIKDFF